jgi:hypothetical protein
MRHRRSAALVAAVAAFALLGTAACGDDSDDKGKPAVVPPSGAASAPAAGATSAAPGTSAAPTGTPTEGTSSQKPPKKGGKANQGPVGRQGG